MAVNKNSGTDVPNLDDLLEPEPQAVAEPTAPATPASVIQEEDPAKRRIRELQEELERESLAPTANGRPVPESALTEDQRTIRDLEDRLARKRADTDVPVQYDEGTGETLLIHFLEDGFISQGTIMYRGMEQEFVIGGPAYKQAEKWLRLVDDIDGQFDRWGKQMFARGPWRGRRWGDTTGVTDPEEAAAIRAAADAERKRSRRAPIISV